MSSETSGLYERIYSIVRQIPYGKVASYGQIALMVEGSAPRIVGYAMAAVTPESGVPWHRVINSRGEISKRFGGTGDADQKALLESEGITFNEKNRIDMKKYGWIAPEFLLQSP